MNSDFDTSAFDGDEFETPTVRVKQTSGITLFTADHVTTETETDGYFDMEGYAVAKVCELNNVKCLLLKTVTDIIGSGTQDEQYSVNFSSATEELAEKVRNALNLAEKDKLFDVVEFG